MDSKHAESYWFPLCFSSFEILKQRIKVSIQKHKFETMENFINFFEIDDEKEEQSCNQSKHLEKNRNLERGSETTKRKSRFFFKFRNFMSRRTLFA